MACTHCSHPRDAHTAVGCKATVGDGGFCPCTEPPAKRTLAEWSKDWPYRVTPWHPGRTGLPPLDAPSRVYVTPDTLNAPAGVRAEAFALADVVVSSVTAGSIWFTARD